VKTEARIQISSWCLKSRSVDLSFFLQKLLLSLLFKLLLNFLQGKQLIAKKDAHGRASLLLGSVMVNALTSADRAIENAQHTCS